MALADPFGGLGEADAVDVEEFLEDFVGGFEASVVETAESVCPDYLFDLECEAFADEGDCGCFFLGGYLVRLLAESCDCFTICCRAKVVLDLSVVVIRHFLQNLDRSRVWITAVVLAIVLLHAAEVALP